MGISGSRHELVEGPQNIEHNHLGASQSDVSKVNLLIYDEAANYPLST